MQIEIENGLANVTYKKGRRAYNKTVTLPTLVAAMMQEQGIKTPLLPLGTRAYIRNDNQHTILLEFQAAPRLMQYVNDNGKQIFKGVVPMPWGLFKLTFREQGPKEMDLVGTRVFALKRPIITPEDQLYFFPVPNIHQDGGICWGSTFSGGNNKIAGVHEAGKVIDLFFSSQFNTHISPRFNMYQRYEDMLREFVDKKTFDYEILVPMKGERFSSLM